MTEAIERVRRMEQCFDALQEMARQDPTQIDSQLVETLRDYYDGGQWLQDYTLDEQGCFPVELKRGVLSQDGVYDFLEEYGRIDVLSRRGGY